MVETILSRGPVAVRLALETIRRGMNMSQPEGEIIESDMFALAATTTDMREGMARVPREAQARLPRQLNEADGRTMETAPKTGWRDDMPDRRDMTS